MMNMTPTDPGREELIASESWHVHKENVQQMHDLIRGCGPKDHAERERLLWLLVLLHAGALTPVSVSEKRGMERILAILDRKLAEGGGIGGNPTAQYRHNNFYRGRWSAFRE